MHEDIERFTQQDIFIADDKDLIRLKTTMIEDLEEEMRLMGVMRTIDIDPHWSMSYNFEERRYECVLSLYGIYVGEDNCPEDYKIMNGKRQKVK